MAHSDVVADLKRWIADKIDTIHQYQEEINHMTGTNDTHIMIRLTKGQKDRLAAKAASLGLKVSTWIRMTALEAAGPATSVMMTESNGSGKTLNTSGTSASASKTRSNTGKN